MNFVVKALTVITCIGVSSLVFSANMDPNSRTKVRVFEGVEFGFKNPEGIAIDADDNVWITNDNSVTKILADNSQNPIIYEGPAYQFDKPRAITVDKIRNNVWIANFKGHSVTKIPVNFSESPTVYKAKQFKMVNPNGIAVDTKGNVFVSSASSRYYMDFHVTKIPAYNPNKPIVYQNKNFKLSQPYAVATDADDNLWVTTGYYHNVVKIPANYPNSDPVSYNYTDPRPESMTVDNRGNVWVANTWPNPSQGNSVLKLPINDPEHRIVYKDYEIVDGKKVEDKKYEFDYPRAIAADSKGNIWVSNSRGNSVTKIPANDPTHPVVYKGKQYSFKFPCGIAVDSKGNVWVVNSGGNSVTKIVSNWK